MDTNKKRTEVNNLTPYELFEGADPFKRQTEIVIHKESNPGVVITITIDTLNNRISDVRSPAGIRHIFRMGNVLNKRLLDNWMVANGFVEKTRRETKKALKGRELIKFMMKRGYRG